MDIACPIQKLSVPTVSSNKVREMMTQHGVVILDVRSDTEFHESHLAGSMQLPYKQVLMYIEAMIPQKNTPVYVYCASGSRSSFAVRDMISLGYTNVHNMSGGIMAWIQQGYDVVK